MSYLCRIIVALFVLVPVSGEGQTLYWAQDPGSSLLSTDVATLTPQVRDTLSGVYAIATGSGVLYWTEPNANRIRFGGHQSGTDSVFLDLSADTTIPRGIAVFSSANTVYWSDSRHGRIECARLSDGQNVRTLVSGLSSPGMMALDVTAHKLYWIDNGVGKKSISRCDTSGINVETVVSGLSETWGLALDPPNTLLYFIDSGVGRILQANYGGTLPAAASNLATQVAIADNVRGLALDAAHSQLYWSDISTSSIQRVTTNGSTLVQAVSGSAYAQGISLSAAGDVLPVELSTFTAQAGEGAVTVHWTAQTETGAYKFEIERRTVNGTGSTAGNTSAAWVPVGWVNGSGTSASPHEYSFTDQGVPDGNYEYRIVMIDVQGGSTTSGTMAVTVGSVPKAYALSQNFPNPFNPSTVIAFAIPNDGFVRLAIYNALGQELARLVDENLPAGHYRVTFDAQNLPSGLYVSKLTAGKFAATKKMILLK